MNLRFRSVLTCTALLSVAVAQRPEDAGRIDDGNPDRRALPAVLPAGHLPVATPREQVPLAGDLYTTPIRGGADDLGHRYGTWASGPDYKVSFHDGLAFYPVVGDRYPHNLPLKWRTTSVRIGDAELLVAGEDPVTSASDWRMEYRFGAVTEAYDVRKDGVEQTFVVPVRPLAGGELRITGRVTSELIAAERGFAHAQLRFAHQDGTVIVSYGAATAIDALGTRLPMETAFDDGSIVLRLPADALATARFPLVVDPLLGNQLVSYDSSSRQASRPDVARDDAANQLLTVYGRLNAGGDYDAYARITADDFTGSTLVWSDVTASWSTRNCDVAFVGGPDRWIIAIQRDFPAPTGSWLRFHTRASNDLVASTAYVPLAGSNGNTLSMPDVGGTDAFSAGDNALVVYQSDVGLANSTTSAVFARLIDVRNDTVGAAIDLEAGVNLDRETPSVNQVSDGGAASWICCWTQLDNSIAEDDWDLIIRRLDSAGVSQGRSFLGNAASSVHAFVPRVAGRGGRYTASYGESPNPAGVQVNGWADEIRIHRFDWSEFSASPVKLDVELVRAAGAAAFWNGNIAYDNMTHSHWALAYHGMDWNVYAARAGFDGGVCESVTVYDTASLAFSPGITFDDDNNRFALVFTANEAGVEPRPVYGTHFTYPAFAQPLAYGLACGPALIGSNSNAHGTKPHSGAEFFAVRAINVPANALGALNIGLAPAADPIPFLPGCFSNVGALVVSLGASATGTVATIPLPIPGGVIGDVFVQYLYADPGSPNAIPVSTTRGLRIFVR
ncbi:MAG: hypothetical protein HZB39_14170 [Planctomycetes bacterium]|nr:hypothetical protein [Planctomycetota bacterium]